MTRRAAPEQEPLFAAPGELEAPAPAHHDDPPTSTAAAASIAPIVRGLRLRILGAYNREHDQRQDYHVGLTAEEAGIWAGLELYQARRRVTELRNLGYLKPCYTDDGYLTRPGASGRNALVLKITPSGREAFELARRASP